MSRCALCGNSAESVRFYVVNGREICVFCTDELTTQRVGNMLGEALAIREFALGQLHAIQQVVSHQEMLSYISRDELDKMVKELEDQLKGVGL